MRGGGDYEGNDDAGDGKVVTLMVLMMEVVMRVKWP